MQMSALSMSKYVCDESLPLIRKSHSAYITQGIFCRALLQTQSSFKCGKLKVYTSRRNRRNWDCHPVSEVLQGIRPKKPIKKSQRQKKKAWDQTCVIRTNCYTALSTIVTTNMKLTSRLLVSFKKTNIFELWQKEKLFCDINNITWLFTKEVIF